MVSHVRLRFWVIFKGVSTKVVILIVSYLRGCGVRKWGFSNFLRLCVFEGFDRGIFKTWSYFFRFSSPNFLFEGNFLGHDFKVRAATF